MKYRNHNYHIFAIGIIISSLILIFPTTTLSQTDARNLPIGAECRRSFQCGMNLGCRESDITDKKICKISIPNVPGCTGNFAENMCADGMECIDNVCKSTFGLPGETDEMDRVRFELGSSCTRSYQCGINMGCRPSDIRQDMICKITVPGENGCDIGAEENMCADDMVCKDTTCIPTYGIPFLKDKTKTDAEGSNWPSFDIGAPMSAGVSKFFGGTGQGGLSPAQKLFNIFMAIVFLTGLTLMVKGLLVYHTALGFMPAVRKGYTFMGIGFACMVGSVFLWFLFG